MRKRGDKKHSVKGRDVIVFDEFNNGSDLGGKNTPIIMLGYLSRPGERKNPSVFKHSVETGFFGKRHNELSEAVAGAQEYAADHSRFYYTTISHAERKAAPLHSIKANAVALLTYRFLSEYQLNIRNLSWVLHEMDGAQNTRKIIEEAGEWMRKGRIQRPRAAFYKGDNHPIIKLAHNCIHSVAYLSLLQQENGVRDPDEWVVDKENWPFPGRRVPGVKKQDLDKIAREFRKKTPPHKIQKMFLP